MSPLRCGPTQRTQDVISSDDVQVSFVTRSGKARHAPASFHSTAHSTVHLKSQLRFARRIFGNQSRIRKIRAMASAQNVPDRRPEIKYQQLKRHQHVATLFGQETFQRIATARILVVGAGGIGCELLKNLAMVGFGDIQVVSRSTSFKSCRV